MRLHFQGESRRIFWLVYLLPRVWAGWLLLLAVGLFAAPPSGAVAGPRMQTLVGKHVVGYQGWFSCPGDAAKLGWRHWFKGERPSPESLVVDMWPDTSEFDRKDLCATGLMLRSGQPAYLFSSENPAIVLRHFQWMRDYGIDGVALARFDSELRNPIPLLHTNIVLQNVRHAAEVTQRGFFIIYDLSGQDPNIVDRITKDWDKLTIGLRLTESPSYMWHRARPVVGLWGMGVRDRPLTVQQARELISYFRHARVPATVLAGLPAYWRTLGRDSHQADAWAGVYRSVDVISPWTVGRFDTATLANLFVNRVMIPDIVETQRQGIDYMPVIFPGMSWHNRWSGKIPLNNISRDCGRFYMQAAQAAIKAGATMLQTATFDEVNEGTAIFKVATQQSNVPIGASMATLDDGGCGLTSDWYLRLAGRITAALHSKH